MTNLIIFLILLTLVGCTQDNPKVPKKASTTNTPLTVRNEPSTTINQKINEIKSTLPENGRALINRIENCDHLAGELNGIPSEDIDISRKISEERCSELDKDINEVSDTKVLDAVKMVQKLLEEQYHE